ncbi:type II toxin-antitoxin system RelE/ParE family toxin [Ligilactobacillus sp. LYQ135]
MAIYLYEDKRGKILFLDWYYKIKEKDPSIYRKVNDMLDQMRNQSLPLTRPTVKRMILRLPYRHLYKIRLGKYRLMFIAQDGDYFIMHAFRKTTQKTPDKEIHQVDREIKQHHYILLKSKMLTESEY